MREDVKRRSCICFSYKRFDLYIDASFDYVIKTSIL